MGLFKSKNERRLDREVTIRKGINLIRKNIRDLGRHEREYLAKARRAKQIGARDQLEFLKAAVRRCAGQRLLLERQLLSLETATQVKNQAEAHGQFARAMQAVSRSIAEAFGSTDLMKTQADLEQALAKAETLEERMELFLEMTQRPLGEHAGAMQEAITDEEIQRRIDSEIATEESGDVDQEIREGLDEIRRELGKD